LFVHVISSPTGLAAVYTCCLDRSSPNRLGRPGLLEERHGRSLDAGP
jgi:hypothetical protein